MHLVDEKNDGLDRLARLFEQRLQARLELAPHAGTSQQRPDVEAQQTRVLEIRWHLAAGDGQSEPFDNGGLAHTGLAREQGIVLPPAQQDVDHRANFVFAPDDRIDLPTARALGQIGAVLGQRGFVIGLIGDGAAGLPRYGWRQARAVVWPFAVFRRSGNDGGDGVRQLVCTRAASSQAPRTQRSPNSRLDSTQARSTATSM